MYLMGKGHEHEGPGTSMVQRINWTRANEIQMNNAMRGRGPGLGCVGLGCVPEFRSDCKQMSGTCNDFKGLGCGCTKPGMNCGMGLFDSMDPSTWGIAEWGIVALGGYMVISTVFTTKRAVGRVGEGLRRTRRRLGKRISG